MLKSILHFVIQITVIVIVFSLYPKHTDGLWFGYDDEPIDLITGAQNIDGDVCELHRVPLQRDCVRISYGMMLDSPNNKTIYPNSNSWVGGGCVGGGRRYALVLFCAECRKEYELQKKISLER